MLISLAVALLMLSNAILVIGVPKVSSDESSNAVSHVRPAPPRNSQPNRSYSLPPYDNDSFPVQSYGGNTKLKFAVTALAALDIYVTNSSQFSVDDLEDQQFVVYHDVASNVSTEVSLPSKGLYYLLLINDISGINITFDVTYWTVPVDIYSFYSSPPAPTGLTDYGVQNSSGTILAYEEEISQVAGDAVIRRISAYNGTPVEGSSPYGAGLQLNVVLRVNTTSGQYDYWLQNTLTLYTNNDTANFVDNIWNLTSSTAQLNESEISGAGMVSPSDSSNFYWSETNFFRYATPETLRMVIVVSYSRQGVTAAFGYRRASGGIQLSSKTTFYDRATITEPQTIRDASIVVSGYEMTPSGNFFDAEFVFTGDTNGASTTFKSMDSTLNLAYTLANGVATGPRSLYEFGSNTAEAAYNLLVNRVSNGFQVGLGSIDFGESYTTLVVITCKPFSVSTGASTTCTAKVTGALPTGTVTFSSNGGGAFSSGKGSSASNRTTCKLSEGSCSVKYRPNSAISPVNVTASYSGDVNNLGAFGNFSLTVTMEVSKIKVSCTPTSVVAGSSKIITCTAKVTSYSPTGTVSWSQSRTGSVFFASTTCTLTKGACSVWMTAMMAGKVILQAIYSGDPNNQGSSQTATLTVK